MRSNRDHFLKRRGRSRSFQRRLRFEMFESRDLLAVNATLSLGEPTINGTVADFDVALDFTATSGEELAYFSLDVEPSSTSLVGPGPDYSAFTFAKASPLLDAWTQIGFFNDPGFESTVEFDDSLVASLPPGVYVLGTLTVDFGAAGLTPRSTFTVAINGQGTVIGVEDPNQGFEFKPVTFNPASRDVVPASISGANSVNEGSPYTLTIVPPDNFAGSIAIDWGDGQQETIAIQNLPANGEVIHTFPDGPFSPTVVVDLVASGGATTRAGSLTLDVINVKPDLAASGAASVAEGSPFVLTLGAVSDPGDDTISRYVIDWGDGEQQSINAADLPASREVEHTYRDGPASASIVIDLVDEDGTHAAVETRTVAVNDVPPQVVISGPASVDEGATYLLTIGSVNDPGVDAVSQFVVHWGDGQQQTINAADLPASRQIAHTYADGPLSATIVIDLIDDDGTHVAVDSRSVTINDSAPQLTLSGPASIDEGVPYILTIGNVNDPGDDAVTQYVVHWGDGQQQTIRAVDLPASRQVTHTYADGPLSPTIVVDLIDEDGTHTGAGSLPLTVNNVRPIVSISGDATVNEGSPFTLNIGSVTDPGNDTVTQYVIHWGDGQVQTIPAASLPPNRTVTHTYLDGPLSPTIVVDLVDEDANHPASDTLPITVRNVVPTTSLTGPATVREGSSYTLTIGEVNDPGIDTVTQYRVHWGDGQVETIDAADIPPNRQISHTYFDGPFFTTIQVDVVDEDGTHVATGELTLNVTNVEPSITLSGPSVIAEDSPYVLTIGGLNDPANDIVRQLVVDWGDGTVQTFEIDELPTDGTLTHTFDAIDANVTIRVTLLDDAGTQLAEFTHTIEVVERDDHDVLVNRFDTTASVPGETGVQTTVTATVEFVDVDIAEDHTVTIDWGDGSPPQLVTITQSNEIRIGSVTHEYETGGVFTVRLTITDDNGVEVERETKAYVTGFRVVTQILQIVGSEGNDIITATPEQNAGMFVSITIPAIGNVRRSFRLADVQGIDVYVGVGNDRVMISERLNIATYIDGGPNEDHVQGGNGPNILIGGPGNDTILGGEERDVLIGGTGENRLLAYGGDDVLIGGAWNNADDQRVATFSTWSSAESFEERQRKLSQILDIESDSRRDWLFGGDGNNLYYLSASDVLEDGNSHISQTLEQLVDLGWAIPHDHWEGIFTAVPNPSGEHANDSMHPLSAESEGPVGIEESVIAFDARDVNRDGYVSPQDVIVVINALNGERGGRVIQGSENLDANRDGWVTSMDALGTINFLNARMITEGESAIGRSRSLVLAPTTSLPRASKSALLACNEGGPIDSAIVVAAPSKMEHLDQSPDFEASCGPQSFELEEVLLEIAPDIAMKS